MAINFFSTTAALIGAPRMSRAHHGHVFGIQIRAEYPSYYDADVGLVPVTAFKKHGINTAGSLQILCKEGYYWTARSLFCHNNSKQRSRFEGWLLGEHGSSMSLELDVSAKTLTMTAATNHGSLRTQ